MFRYWVYIGCRHLCGNWPSRQISSRSCSVSVLLDSWHRLNIRRKLMFRSALIPNRTHFFLWASWFYSATLSSYQTGVIFKRANLLNGNTQLWLVEGGACALLVRPRLVLYVCTSYTDTVSRQPLDHLRGQLSPSSLLASACLLLLCWPVFYSIPPASPLPLSGVPGLYPGNFFNFHLAVGEFLAHFVDVENGLHVHQKLSEGKFVIYFTTL